MSCHVVQLGPVPPPEGGVSRNVQAIRDELCSRGHRCSIVATSRSSAWADDTDIYRPSGATQLIRQVRALRPDILHLHIGGELNTRLQSLALAASFLADKTVLTVHSGAFPLSRAAKTASPFSRWGFVFRRFSHLIAVSDQMADLFARFGVESHRISTLSPHSLRIPDENVSVPIALTEFIDSHSPALLAVGGLEADYDPLFQITALENVFRDHPHAGLMIVGDGSMRQKVEAAVARTNYSDRVMLAGNVEHAVTLHLLRQADIMLRTTLFDGDAISVREALFLGTPVIATDNGMRPMGVELIKQGNVEEFAAKVRSICGSAKPARNGHHAPDTSNIAAVVDLYEKLASI